jgi:tRNA (adenine57-N1/adenine58-N1)-methyltransferase
MKGKKILLINKDSFLFLDSEKDSNTQFGIIKSKDLKKLKNGSKIKTHTGVGFYAVEPSNPDLIKKVIRLPQIITLKDIGSIVMYLGIKNGSKVFDAGSGSGINACVIASLSNEIKVYSYEIRRDFIKVATKNSKLFGLDNIKFINKDVREGIKEKNFTCGILDIPEPWSAIPVIQKNFSVGARIVTYSPSIIQVEKTLRNLPKCFKVERLIQNNEVNWKVEIDKDILRPETNSVYHTGFLLFIRKTSKE